VKDKTPDLLKFKKLHGDLRRDVPCIERATIIGYLTLLWSHCYGKGSPYLPAEDVEAAAEWTGTQGVFLKAAIRHRWLDVVRQPIDCPIEASIVGVHNFWKHAFSYVRATWVSNWKTTPWSPESNLDPKRNPNGISIEASIEAAIEATIPPSSPLLCFTSPCSALSKPPLPPLKSESKTSGAERKVDTTELFSKLGCSKPVPLIDEIMATSGDGEHMRPWWAKVVDLHRSPDRLSELIDDLKHVQDSGNPVARQAKGLGGEFDAPGKWLVKQCKERLGILPRFPKMKGSEE
jgi:hypothetical protein